MDDVAKKQQIFPPIFIKKALIANEYPKPHQPDKRSTFI
jgi:hypothetical protein